MIRRVGAPPERGIRYRLRPGVYAILPQAGGLLLTLQCDPDPDLQLPGGGVDPGESPLQALHREVIEETGWTIGRPRRLGAFRRFVFMPEYGFWAEKLCTVFVARPAHRVGPPSEAGHTAVTLAIPDAIVRLGNDGDRMFVSRWAESG